MVYPEALASAMMKSQDTILICPTIASQIGALAALAGRPPLLRAARARAGVDPRDRRLRAVDARRRSRSVPAADGAFYCLLRVNTTLDPMALAERLIREHKVAVIPGPRSA